MDKTIMAVGITLVMRAKKEKVLPASSSRIGAV